MSDNRDRGLEFGDFGDDLEDESYPLSKAELLEKYGDRRIEHANGSDAIREIVSNESDEVYESADDVREALLNMVGSEAVGRERYSDRGAGTAERENEEQSF